MRRSVDAVCGVILVSFGLRLAFSSRSAVGWLSAERADWRRIVVDGMAD
jgi:hypothetical protein